MQQYISQLLGAAPSAETVRQRNSGEMDELRAELRKEYEPAIRAYEQQQADAAWESMLTDVFADKRSLPNGTDEKKVRETLDQIANSPDPSREIALLVARAFANSPQHGGGARPRLPGAGGRPAPEEPETKPGDTNEDIMERQLARLRAS